MIEWRDDTPIYLHKVPVDFRKSINGLSVTVVEAWQFPITEPSLFVFCNKTRRQIKVLYWDINGFALSHKRLEQNVFKWPKQQSADTISLTYEQWCWLLRGFDLTKNTFTYA